jgi:predicted negative regulator of RcsB-dependent stress response
LGANAGVAVIAGTFLAGAAFMGWQMKNKISRVVELCLKGYNSMQRTQDAKFQEQSITRISTGIGYLGTGISAILGSMMVGMGLEAMFPRPRF